MRKVLICVSALLMAAALAAPAGAAVNYNSSKSNSVNFTAECTKGGGKVATANGQTSCTLPGGAPATGPLTAACGKDGGKIVPHGGASTCQYDQPSGQLTGRRAH